ncbi:hypothetical protein Q7689_32795, partial [Nocardiopsis tropica]|nr:hypothetical protein [Nocardiopsis tropica]
MLHASATSRAHTLNNAPGSTAGSRPDRLQRRATPLHRLVGAESSCHLARDAEDVRARAEALARTCGHLHLGVS